MDGIPEDCACSPQKMAASVKFARVLRICEKRNQHDKLAPKRLELRSVSRVMVAPLRKGMSLKILLAVDGSEASANAVRFAAKVLGRASAKDDSITVFHVAVTLPDTLLTPGISQSLAKPTKR
jgi:hypothetical protein